MELCLIWAQARNRAIGRNNSLPWRCPEDLQRFKALTLGCPVIMGRKTFDSLPRAPLPGRLNIVLSRTSPAVPPPDWIPAQSLDLAMEAAARSAASRAYVIGGQSIYEDTLPGAHRLFVTDIDLDVAGADAFAPEIPGRFEVVREDAWRSSTTGLRYRFSEWAVRP